MAATTSPRELMQLAYVLSREAARLDAVRDELHQMVRASRGEWEGTVADRFRVHAGPGHRQHQLEVARDRLRHAARLIMDAANDPPPSGHNNNDPQSSGHKNQTHHSQGSVSGGGEG